jgi:hypothetical protein
MRKLIFAALLAVFSLVFASFEAVFVNPNSVRLGNISGFKRGDILIPFMDFKSPGLTANYMIPFGLPELSMQEVSYSGMISNYPFVLAGTNFGNEDYRENSVLLSVQAYGTEGFKIYPAAKYYMLKDALGSKNSFGLDMNASYHVTKSLKTVVSVINLYAYETESLDIPMTACLNFEYRTEEKFNFYTGVEKDSRNPAVFKTGLEYEPFDFFAVSAGYNFDPGLVTTGFSLLYKGISFSYGMSYHFDLDYSHSFGLVYEF